MRKFIDSGGAFMALALLSMVAGVFSENGAVFVSAGAFWMIMAIVVRKKNRDKRPPEDKS